MECLKIEPVRIEGADGPREFLCEEKDHGDLVVYDIYSEGRYLLTLARDGSILFMNFEANARDKEVFKLSYLNHFIEKIQTVF
jgi:hypothetical protein